MVCAGAHISFSVVEVGKGSLMESVCTSGVDSHHRLAEGRELSGEGDSAWLAQRA